MTRQYKATEEIEEALQTDEHIHQDIRVRSVREFDTTTRFQIVVQDVGADYLNLSNLPMNFTDMWFYEPGLMELQGTRNGRRIEINIEVAESLEEVEN